MKVKYYYQTDLEYANKRLSGTFVRTDKNELVYVEQVHLAPDGTHVIFGRKFSSKDKLNPMQGGWGLPAVEVPVKDIDMTPIMLGYIFSERLGKAIYVSRFPMRSLYKQGLHMNGLSFSDGSREHLLPSDLFSPMLNIYPSLKQAYAILKKDGPMSLPFSRSFALKSNQEIEYMGRQVVGHVDVSNATPVAVLDPKFAYLQQHLDWSTK